MTADEARVRVVANGWVDQGDGTLELTALGEVRILERLDDGKVTTVYRADLRGSPVALKIFKPRSIRRHAGRSPLNIAEFEYRRNRAFFEAPGLARYVTRPIGYFHAPGVSAVVQELLRGKLYYHYHRTEGAEDPARLEALFAHIRRIVKLAHESELFDLDLHALNVMVVQEVGEPIPKLFDFNRIPFYEHPRNPLEALLLRTRLLDVGSRDRRKLRQFHDFRRLESWLNRS
jgi:hypothetical protein